MEIIFLLIITIGRFAMFMVYSMLVVLILTNGFNVPDIHAYLIGFVFGFSFSKQWVNSAFTQDEPVRSFFLFCFFIPVIVGSCIVYFVY